jgi:rhamnose utilization protein RhaD (predicted bifunctional aldolase and dehydrogenase)
MAKKNMAATAEQQQQQQQMQNNSSANLLSTFQDKLAELTELANELGQNHHILGKGLNCSSKFRSKELANGEVQVYFGIKATLPAIKVDVTF